MDLARIELGVEAQSYDLARSDVNACCTGRLQAQYLALVDLFEHSAAQPRRALGLPAEGPLDHKRIQTAFRERGLLVHPDKLQSRLATQAFTKLSQAVNELVQTHVASELTHHNKQGEGVYADELSVDPAYAWWTEWFPAGPAPDPASAEQRTAADAEQQDVDYLAELLDDDLQVEAAARQDAVMRALGGVGLAAEASERLRRVRVEVMARGGGAADVSQGSTAAMDEAREFAAGGFF